MGRAALSRPPHPDGLTRRSEPVSGAYGSAHPASRLRRSCAASELRRAGVAPRRSCAASEPFDGTSSITRCPAPSPGPARPASPRHGAWNGDSVPSFAPGSRTASGPAPRGEEMPYRGFGSAAPVASAGHPRCSMPSAVPVQAPLPAPTKHRPFRRAGGIGRTGDGVDAQPLPAPPRSKRLLGGLAVRGFEARGALAHGVPDRLPRGADPAVGGGCGISGARAGRRVDRRGHGGDPAKPVEPARHGRRVFKLTTTTLGCA